MAADTAPGDVLRLKETYGGMRTPPLSGIFLRVHDVAPNGEPIVLRGGAALQLPRGSYKIVIKAG